MRPFRCIERDDEHWCHLPYPHQIRQHFRAVDLTDLEYDLPVIWKHADAHGVTVWNRGNYCLQTQGGRLTGRLYEIDMDTLPVPRCDR